MTQKSIIKKITLSLIYLSITGSVFATIGDGVQTIAIPQTGQTPANLSLVDHGDDSLSSRGVPWAYSQKSQTLTPASRFTIGQGVESNCITDNLTGLMWVRNPNTVPLNKSTTASIDSYPNAVISVDNINKDKSICGHDDWYIPSINEMRSLINYGVANPMHWLNENGFQTSTSFYWSSTVKVANSSEPGGPGYYNWTLNGFTGGTHFSNSSPNGGNGLWPVRRSKLKAPALVAQTGDNTSHGVPLPVNRFVKDASGECITDTLTGLTWLQDMKRLPTSQDGASRLYSWQKAVAAASQLNKGKGICGRRDWRLPNINELSSLVNTTQGNMGTWLNSQGFNTLGNGYYYTYYWTSTINANDPYYAWVMYSNGKFIDAHVNSVMSVLPVSGGKCNTTTCNNIPPKDSPMVSVPEMPQTEVANTPLTLENALPGDLNCAYYGNDLNVKQDRYNGTMQTSVLDVMSQANQQKANNISAPMTWDFISGAYRKSRVYGSAYCAFNHVGEYNRSGLLVYRTADTLNFEGRTSVAAANDISATITCNLSTKPAKASTQSLKSGQVLSCNIGGTNSTPKVILNSFTKDIQ